MIIYGTKTAKTGNIDVYNTKCNYCENRGTQRISIYNKYFHLFWIPIFPFEQILIAECTHCRRTIDKREISKELYNAYEMEKYNQKRPLWMFSGLLIFGGIVALTFCIALFSSLTIQKDPRKEMLTNDELLLSKNPLIAKDTISNVIKLTLDSLLEKEARPENIKYLTKVNGDKSLIILQIPTFKKFSKEDQTSLLEILEYLCSNQDSLSNKKNYIAIKGNFNYFLYKTPDKTDSGNIVDETPLLEYYKESVPHN